MDARYESINKILDIITFVFKRPPIFPRSLIFAIIFMSLYSVGIALCKDIPDIEGDATFGIYSFSARLGQKRVFRICVSLFKMAFGVVFLAGAMSPSLWIKIVTKNETKEGEKNREAKEEEMNFVPPTHALMPHLSEQSQILQLSAPKVSSPLLLSLPKDKSPKNNKTYG
ncbi:hypothetical protein Fmac_027487 [Flemingia macrophylla]|uniref:Uncharacterized protein n=1 Tax=Flemingia macrophylla TaxID=520843 RepID=A0ABD1LI29_9FABA